MRKTFIAIVLLFAVSSITAQQTIRRALFLGNSYTFVNDLPGLIAQLAHSAGDSLFHDQHTPGGYTLGWNPIAHSTDPNSLAKIAQNGWDFVVIQEQSQTPAIPALRDSCMYPGSVILHDSVKSANPCARVLFFLTWGRRFGGQQCFNNYYCSTAFVDFDQMQDSVTRSYKMIADSLGDWIAPVGEAWRFSIGHYPDHVLHMSDDSHPGLKGSYLAACVFYDVIFGKRSFGLSYLGGLSDTAFLFQQIADSIVFGDPASWNLWSDQPVAAFKTIISGDTLFTQNQSINATIWHWDFGDGITSDLFEPVHIFTLPGHYTVTLTACDSCRCDTATRDIVITYTGCQGTSANRGKISLSTPDYDGILRMNGFHDRGVLSFFDISGRSAGSFQVINGKTNIAALPAGFYAWILENSFGHTVGKGKYILPSGR